MEAQREFAHTATCERLGLDALTQTVRGEERVQRAGPGVGAKQRTGSGFWPSRNADLLGFLWALGDLPTGPGAHEPSVVQR